MDGIIFFLEEVYKFLSLFAIPAMVINVIIIWVISNNSDKKSKK